MCALKKTFIDVDVSRAVRLFRTGPYEAVQSSKLKMLKNECHMIICLLTELGWAVRKNIWLSVICMDLTALGLYGITLHLEPHIFPYGPPTQSIST